MSLYALLDLAVVAAPLALSFDRRVTYLKRWPAALAACAVVGIPFLVWDSLMATKGAWSFSRTYAGNLLLFHLPPGEFLFFLSAPFASIFIFEVVRAHVPEKPSPSRRLPWLVAAAAAALASYAALPRLYTATVCLALALFLVVAALVHPELLRSRRFWISIGISFVPFLICNGALTSLPVVTYADAAILEIRIGTIPVEDFFYNFTLLGFAFLSFSLFRGRS